MPEAGYLASRRYASGPNKLNPRYLSKDAFEAIIKLSQGVGPTVLSTEPPLAVPKNLRKAKGAVSDPESHGLGVASDPATHSAWERGPGSPGTGWPPSAKQGFWAEWALSVGMLGPPAAVPV